MIFCNCAEIYQVSLSAHRESFVFAVITSAHRNCEVHRIIQLCSSWIFIRICTGIIYPSITAMIKGEGKFYSYIQYESFCEYFSLLLYSVLRLVLYGGPECITWFIEVQDFWRSLPPSPVSKLDRQHPGRLRKRDDLLRGEEGDGVGEESNHTSVRKLGPL